MPQCAKADLSVVVPAYRAERTLCACVESLLAQRDAGNVEVIVVASADRPEELPKLPSHPALTLIGCTPRQSAATARNLGAAHARGKSIVFTDADVVAPPDWLARLEAAGNGACCVAGAIANGTPRSVSGTVEYLVEFFDLHPARPEEAWHGATANLLVPRRLWDTYGPFPEDMDGCEDTLLTTRLRADGRFRFAGDAYVVHQNRQGMRAVLAHQYALGASHARLEQRSGNPPTARYGLLRASARMVYLYTKVAGWTPRELPRALRLGPLVIPTFAAWGLGLAREALRLRRVAHELT